MTVITAAAITTTTSTVTVVSVITSTTDTTTISTSSGFLPVSSTLPNSKKRSVNAGSGLALGPRHGTLLARTSNQQCPAVKKGQPFPTTYPKSVVCYKLVVAYSISTVTKTAGTTATTTLMTSTSTQTVCACLLWLLLLEITNVVSGHANCDFYIHYRST